MARRPRHVLVAALGGVVALLVVRVLAYTGPGHWLDAATLHGFTDLVTGRTAPLADTIAHLCDPAPFAVIGLVLLAIAVLRGRPRVALAVAAMLSAASVTTQILKPVLADPRFSSLLGADGQIASASWPSGHATAAMSLALAAVLVAGPRWRPLAAAAGGLFAVAVTYAVLALGWHYPSDVLGGFLVAGTWTLLAVAAVGAADRRWPARSGRRLAARVGRTVRASEVLTPTIAGIAAVGAVAVAVLVLRPGAVIDYAQGHTTFVAGAAAIAALGIALATGLALALRR